MQTPSEQDPAPNAPAIWPLALLTIFLIALTLALVLTPLGASAEAIGQRVAISLLNVFLLFTNILSINTYLTLSIAGAIALFLLLAKPYNLHDGTIKASNATWQNGIVRVENALGVGAPIVFICMFMVIANHISTSNISVGAVEDSVQVPVDEIQFRRDPGDFLRARWRRDVRADNSITLDSGRRACLLYATNPVLQQPQNPYVMTVNEKMPHPSNCSWFRNKVKWTAR